MTRTVLIGKSRRITLEELEAVAAQDGKLEIHGSADETCGSFDPAQEMMSTDSIEAALQDLSVEDNMSTANTKSALILLANFIAQNRIMGGIPDKRQLNLSCTAVIAHIVNSCSGSSLKLPSSSDAFFFKLMKIISSSPSCTPIVNHLNSISKLVVSALDRIIPLSIIALSTYQIGCLTKSTVIDALAALSIERGMALENINVDPSLFQDSNYDLKRPHRGMMASASVLRVCIQSSKFAEQNKTIESNVSSTRSAIIKASIESIPAYHGPAADVIATSLKILELECNCFESMENSNKHDNVTKASLAKMNPTIISMTCQTVENAVRILLEGCLTRMGESTDPGDKSSTSITNLALDTSNMVTKLYESIGKEAVFNRAFILDQNKIAAEVIKKKADEKAAKAAAHNSKPDAATSGKDEFEGMTEAQKKKILKKRAEKEAKAAKKKKAKSSSGAGGVSIFGAGSLAIVNSLNIDGSLTSAKIAEIEEIIGKLLSGGVQRKPKIAKGTRDYLPEQMMIRDQAFQIIRRVFKSHGAVEIDTPVFELKDTLTGKYGEDSKLIYDLADQGGELLALRYDLTVPFARFLSLNAVGNIKRFHIGKVYRRDQPQLSKGRYREFYQCDFDIAGTYGRMVPDAECLCVATEILSSLPIGNFGIKLNHRRLLDAILDLSGVPADKFRTICSAVDKLDKEPWSEVKREMVEDKGLAEDVADKIGVFVVQKGEPWTMYKSLMENAVFGKHKGALDALEDLRTVFEYLEAMGKLQYISFDLSLARGLDYYTGIIYEAVCMNGNTQVGSIGGGGRYDNLVSMFQEAGKVTPCVGVSIGIERVFTLMEERLRQEQGGSIKQPNVNVLVAQAGENMMVERMKLSKLLWDAKISAEFNQQENPKLKYEIANALEREIPFMVVIGEDEAKEMKCNIKDLKARTEETVNQSELVATLRSKGVIPVGCEFAAEMMK
uniref:Histidine--tRNA ligase, cytoplasmic n=1 Tax=Chaetoceros debilis TaxID=122233 RepID=A0A7S3Q2R4_9STRA